MDLYLASERLIVMITPEGTRKLVERWKSGFYYIADGARVPVIMAYLDYRRRRVGFSPPVWPTGNTKQDIERWQAFYYDKQAKYPALQMQPDSTAPGPKGKLA